MSISASAHAQAGAVVSIYSDYRFRGVSLSSERPAAVLDVSYDLPNGLYAALSLGSVLSRRDGPQLLGYTANAGFATKVRRDLTADIGVLHSAYSHYANLPPGRSYTEVYIGLAGKVVGARVFISPDYLGQARWTAYGEIDGHYDLSSSAALEASVGVLRGIGAEYRVSGRPQVDGRIAVSQRMGPATVSVAVTSRSRDYLYPTRSARTALVLRLSSTL